MTEMDEKQLNRLLLWLAVYVVASVAISWACGKLPEALSMVTNIASGFFGAAMAMMRQRQQ